MQCPACQQENRPEAIHCKNCGAGLPMQCERCGTVAPAGPANCHNCGNPLPRQANQAAQGATSPDSPDLASAAQGEQIKCTYWGTFNNRRLISCTACGAPIAFVPARPREPGQNVAETPLFAAGGEPPRNPRPPAAYFESPTLLTRLTVIGLGMVCLIELANVVRFIDGYDILDPLESREVSLESVRARAESYENLGDLIFIALGVAFLVNGVVFFVWLHRSSRGTRFLDVGKTIVSPGWAVGLWFIPFVNFVAPFVVVRDLAARVAGFSTNLRREALLGAWWAAIWLSVAVFMVRPKSLATIDEWKESVGFLITGHLLIGLAAICAAAIVLKISRGSEARASAVVSEWQRAQEAERAEQAPPAAEPTQQAQHPGPPIEALK